MITVDGRKMLTTMEELVDPAHTVLLVVDIQNDFCSPGGYFDKVGTDMSMIKMVPPRVKKVLESARRSGILVVHIQHTLYPNNAASSGSFLRMGYIKMVMKQGESTEVADQQPAPPAGVALEGTWGWQIADEVAARPGEIIIRKHRSSSFSGTDLDMMLRTNDIKSVVVVGLVTEGCMGMTAIGAQFCDYYPIVLRDCVASGNRELHEAMLLILSNRMDVVDSSGVLEIWDKSWKNEG
ncbi:cysteine hydrolase family protein [Chloroflexota bacterium]